MPSKKKKYNARFPPARIKKIMQTDEEVGKVAAAVPVIISRALELFVEQLLRKSVEITVSRNAKTLSPAHLKQCILAENRFDFLKDLVLAIPDVQGEGEDSGSVPNTPVIGSQHPPVFRSHSLSDATTSGRGRSVGGTGRPRGRPRKNHSLPQPVSVTKSASDDEDSDLDEDDDDEDEDEDTESEPQRKLPKSSSNGTLVTNPVPASVQFNAAQPNFYQEINSSIQFQINIPPKNGAPYDQGKADDDEDYDT